MECFDLRFIFFHPADEIVELESRCFYVEPFFLFFYFIFFIVLEIRVDLVCLITLYF